MLDNEGGGSEISVQRVAENHASAARGQQLRAQRVRVRPVFLRDPDGERREIMPARVQDQRQPVAQNSIVLASQLLVGGEDTSFGPVAGKLDTPRPPCRVGSEWETTARTVDHQLGELNAARARR